MEKNQQKPYLKNYNLLIAQNLWLAYYQILLIILLKEFIKLNIDMVITMNNVKHAESNKKIVIFFFEYKNLKDDLIKCKCIYWNKKY